MQPSGNNQPSGNPTDPAPAAPATAPTPVSPLPNSPKKSTGLKKAAVILVVGLGAGFLIFAGVLVITAFRAAPEILNGKPITISDTAAKSLVQKDLQPLLERDYQAYYAKYGLDEAYRPGFEKAIDNLAASGDCQLAINTVEKKRGGLDAGPNTLKAAGAVSCKSSGSTVAVTYLGNGKQPEVFRPDELTIEASDPGFVQAAAQIPADSSPNYKGAQNIDRVINYSLRSNQQDHQVLSSLKDNEDGTNPEVISRIGTPFGWATCLPGPPASASLTQRSGKLEAAITYQAVCESHTRSSSL